LVKDRDDFESITAEHAIVRIDSTLSVAEMRKAGLEVIENYPDYTRINYVQAALESANYFDRAGAEPNWTVYCNYACLTSRLNDLVATCPTLLTYLRFFSLAIFTVTKLWVDNCFNDTCGIYATNTELILS